MSRPREPFEYRAIRRDNKKKVLVGYARLYKQEGIDPIKDGDTVSITPNGSIHTRFLNIDSPEKGLYLPDVVFNLLSDNEKEDNDRYRLLNDSHWAEYLEDPFKSVYPNSSQYRDETLGKDLANYLQKKLGKDTAQNHYDFAIKAKKVLSEKIDEDKATVEAQGKNFGFSLGFSHEVFERLGRMLCYISKGEWLGEEQENNLTYNEMMLAQGAAVPYFIFPNTDGFRNAFEENYSLLESIPNVTKNKEAFYQFMQNDKSLQKAIGLVKEARKLSNSVWNKDKPLKLLPFELRFLQRREAPDRYVMNLSSREPKIYPPKRYYEIPIEEDRFFIPSDYIPLFTERGYTVIDEDSD